MIRVDTVLVKLASRCNLNCDYCYVYQMGDDAWKSQPKRMSDGTVRAMASQLDRLVVRQGEPLSVVFHGGEPLLVGPDRFEWICSTFRERLGTSCGLHLQTNGLLLTDRMIEICAAHDVGISISIDGPAAVHDRHRGDHRGRPSHARVADAIRRVASHPSGSDLLSGLLAVIDLEADPAEIYAYMKSLGAPSVDFLYRDGNHDALPAGKASAQSIEYGSWMARLLDVYLADATPIRVRVIDDMLRLILGVLSRKEGVGLTEYAILVIDTDGTVAKNDTLKSVRDGDRFEAPLSVQGGDLIEFVESPQFEAYHFSQRPAAPACHSCPEFAVCGGGMPTHRWSAANGLANPSVFCADQLHLIGRMRERLGLSCTA